MRDDEIRAMVERVLEGMMKGQTDADTQKGSDRREYAKYRETVERSGGTQKESERRTAGGAGSVWTEDGRRAAGEPDGERMKESGACLPDITAIDLRQQFLVKDARDREGYLAMKARTPARLGIGKAGARYRTETMLRVRADHAAAQDAVFSDVDEEFVRQCGFVFVKTFCKDKDEYLTRPDLGRRFPKEELAVIKETCKDRPKVLVIVGDGLSSSAIEANAEDMIPAIRQGLSMKGITLPPILFIKYARVGAMDDVGEATGAEVICMLVGERPGLVTAESMSAYIAYQPRHGLAEAKRTVISNIHKGGTTAVEAGAHAAELILKMLEKKASGIDLK